jgi:hypothetical protein
VPNGSASAARRRSGGPSWFPFRPECGILGWSSHGARMIQALTQEVTVAAGGVVTVRSPDLPPGARAQVVVLLNEPRPEPPSLGSLIGRSPPSFNSADEVDAFINGERDAW